MADNIYFANKTGDELASVVLTKVEDYYQYLQTSGKSTLYKRSYEAYFKGAVNLGKMNRTGDSGEFTSLSINNYRNLLKHLQTMTTSQRPNFEPRATNTDHKSQAQVLLSSSLLEYYLREKKLERYLKQAVEHCLIYAEGFIRAEWDATTGEIYGANPETGAPVYEGDIRYQNFTPLDCIRDFTKQSPLEQDWYIVKTYKNRFDLAAKYPDLADRILEVPDKLDSYRDRREVNYLGYDTDDIAVYEFYHRPTEAVPNGKMAIVLDTDLLLMEGPLPYRDLPVYRIAPGELAGTPFGYTIGFDLLQVQEAQDVLYSTIMTNQSTFGVQNIAIQKGSGINVTSISTGLNLIEYDSKSGKPEPLNLTQTAPEIFNFVQMLDKVGETLSGVNSVVRGNPEANLKSGSALALVQSQAIQFSMDLQQSYAQLLEDIGTATLMLLRDFAKVPRVAAIAGKSQRQYMKEFSGDDLSLVNRVSVDMGNPLTRTTAGKVNLAEQLMAGGLIEDPQQYIMVMQTGKLEPLTENQTAQMMLIRSENEMLSEGRPVRAIITDKHDLHVLEHASVLSSPEARMNPELVTEVTNHMMEHINLYQTMNPGLMQLLKMQPLPPANPNLGQPNAQGEMPMAQSLNPNNPVTQEASKVNMPNQPSPPPGTDPMSAALIESNGEVA